MFACVAAFGVATIVFGVSRSLPLSLAALMVLGAADMVSVVIRSSLVQLETPDEMRGSQRGEFAFQQHRESAGAIRIRARRGLAGNRAFGGNRRGRNPADRGALGETLSVAGRAAGAGHAQRVTALPGKRNRQD